MYIGKQPAVTALTASDITDGIVSNAKLAQDIISADTALAVAPADTDEFLVSDAGTLKRIDYSLIKAANTAEFLAYISTNQTINHNSATKVTFQTESYDPDGVFDNSSNYRFVAPSDGKYQLYTNITNYDASTDIEEFKIFFYKNGSKLTEVCRQKNSGGRLMKDNLTTSLVLNLDEDDYIEVYAYNNQVDSGSTVIEAQSSVIQNYFGGYKLII